jgi:hypothetical protein
MLIYHTVNAPFPILYIEYEYEYAIIVTTIGEFQVDLYCMLLSHPTLTN